MNEEDMELPYTNFLLKQLLACYLADARVSEMSKSGAAILAAQEEYDQRVNLNLLYGAAYGL